MRLREIKKPTQDHTAIKWHCPGLDTGLPRDKAKTQQ